MDFIKICGIKRKEDAIVSIRLGATAIGVIVGALHKTSDEISPEKAKEIVSESQKVNPTVKCVMVTHLENPSDILTLADIVKPTVIQLHSYISVEAISFLKKNYTYGLIGVAHGNSDDLFERVKLLINAGIDTVVVDTKTQDRVGGTGMTHDWTVTSRLKGVYPEIKIILAGGLSPDNVKKAIGVVRPYGVDVNSGVKNSFGYKDAEKIKKFITEVKDETS